MALSRITANSIADGTVVAADIADGSITTAKIADANVTAGKIVSVANTQITGLITTSQLANNLTVNASSIISSSNVDFKVGASQNTSFRIEDTGQLYNSIESTEGTDYRGTLYAGYMCRAWVQFNGTGTPAINASGNVSSITDNGTGDYYVNFTNSMPDTNYAVAMTKQNIASNSDSAVSDDLSSRLVSRVRVYTLEAANLTDSTNINVSVFR